jgi:hypothetical protein
MRGACGDRLRSALLIVLGALLPAPLVQAARLPDWAAAIAAASPEVPAGVPGTTSRILLSETRYAVQPDGSYRIRRRLAVQALSVDVEGVGMGAYHFEETAKITTSHAWHQPPNDVARKNRSLPMDVAVGDAFLSTSKARVIPVDGVKKGSIVFFEFEATEKPYFLTLVHSFYEEVPVSRARFELETPPGWSVRWTWPQGKGPEPVAAGLSRTWEMQDLPAPADEEMAPPAEDDAPVLGINLVPPPGTTVGPAIFADWAAVSRWYEDLGRGRQAPTPAIEAAARQALASGSPAPAETIVGAARMVRDRVRYVAVELGIGGFQPKPAAETLANLYGDCKDKGTLLQALLSASDTPSFPVLVRIGGRNRLSDDVPVWQFDHLVVAVAVPAGAVLPDRLAPALLDDPDLGRLLIVDATDEATAVGSISATLAGRRALVVAGARGKLVTLPGGDPSTHRLERRMEVEIQPDRSLKVHSETRRFGEFAARARADYRTSSRERRRLAEERWTRLWLDALVQDYTADPETPDGAFVETMNLVHSAQAGEGASGLAFFPGVSWDLPRVPLGKRKLAVDYGFPLTLRYEVTLRGYPAGLYLPEGQAMRGEGWEGKVEYRHEESTVRGTLEFRLTRTRFPPESFAELRKFWSAASLLEGGMIPIVP